MNVPSPREPSHGDSRWATVRYALSSNARTARLCLILLVMTGVPGVLLAVVLHHVRLRRAGPVLGVLMPTHGGTRCCHFAEPARPPAGLVRQRGDLDRLRARADAGDKTAGRSGARRRSRPGPPDPAVPNIPRFSPDSKPKSGPDPCVNPRQIQARRRSCHRPRTGHFAVQAR